MCFPCGKLLLYLGLLLLSTHAFSNQADTVRIRKDLGNITQTPHPRHYAHTASLNQVADYIKEEFTKQTALVTEQKYQVNGQEYRNVVASFGALDQPRIIVGAHYDVCGDQPGADDNASGVAGLLELSRLLAQQAFMALREIILQWFKSLRRVSSPASLTGKCSNAHPCPLNPLKPRPDYLG